LKPTCNLIESVLGFAAKINAQNVAQPVFHKVTKNPYRLESSGGYYALIKKNGKQFRRSLRPRAENWPTAGLKNSRDKSAA
jgi:hypothetical protein